MTDQASALRQIVKNMKRQRGQESAGGVRIVTVTSGKGGVGKTNLTVNLAISLAKKGLRVLVIDADFGLSNVDVLLGVTPQYDLSHVVHQSKDITDIITEGPQGIKFISGGSGVLDLLNLSGERFSELISNIEQLDSMADIILFDTGAGISSNILSIVGASTETIVVTTPEPTAIMDAYALIKTIISMDRSVKVHLVVNNADTVAEAEDTLAKFAAVVRIYLKIDLDELGYILSDPSVSKAVKLQKPFLLSFPKSSAAKNIETITWKFMDAEPEKKNGFRGFVERLFRREK